MNILLDFLIAEVETMEKHLTAEEIKEIKRITKDKKKILKFICYITMVQMIILYKEVRDENNE